MIDDNDRATLRSLANRWMELAALPVMEERRRLWTALKDLHPVRPMVLFETWFLENYVSDDELVCQATDLRPIERRMRWILRQIEEIGDDMVLEPEYRVYWDIEWSDYGVPLEVQHADDAQGGQVAYHYNHPIRTPQDIDKLKPRARRADRQKTYRRVERLDDIFGDILPVVLRGTGGLHAALTQDLFKLIGNENLMTWTFDAPEAIHRIMAFLRDDRIAYFDWLEREGLLGLNNDWEMVGSGSPGYTTALPQPDRAGKTRCNDVWAWMESQETTMISPAMFGEFFLPSMAEVARKFGLIYYGCCEPVHDRWDLIRSAIPTVRAVSVSPWCNQRQIAEKLGRDYVYSRKPKAAPISGDTPDWDALCQDLDETVDAARDCNLEIVYRDVYRIGDRKRLGRWVELVRSRIGC
jgi:hypothetical protein